MFGGDAVTGTAPRVTVTPARHDDRVRLSPDAREAPWVWHALASAVQVALWTAVVLAVAGAAAVIWYAGRTRPVIDSPACLVRDVRLVAPSRVEMGETFTVRAVADVARGAPGACPVVATLTPTDQHMVVTPGRQVWDLATSQPAWSVTATGVGEDETPVLAFSLASHVACTRPCLDSVSEHRVVRVRQTAFDAAKAEFATFAESLTLRARQGGEIRPGTPTAVEIVVTTSRPLRRLGFGDVTLEVASTYPPGSAIVARPLTGASGETTFRVVVTAPEAHDFDAALGFVVRTTWHGEPLTGFPRDGSIRLDVAERPWYRAVADTLPSMETILTMVGGGGIVGLVAAVQKRRRKRKRGPAAGAGALRRPGRLLRYLGRG